jgi:hypothetical protein
VIQVACQLLIGTVQTAWECQKRNDSVEGLVSPPGLCLAVEFRIDLGSTLNAFLSDVLGQRNILESCMNIGVIEV